MKRSLLFMLLLITFCAGSQAQPNAPDKKPDLSGCRNIVYAEVLGNSNFGISANYARFIPLKTKQQITFSIRAGIGKVLTLNVGGNPSDESLIAYLTEISVFAGRRFLKPEVGFGFTFLDDVGSYPVGFQQPKTKSLLQTSFGVRLQEPGDRVFLKVGITYGLIDVNEESPDIAVWHHRINRLLPGVALGYRF